MMMRVFLLLLPLLAATGTAQTKPGDSENGKRLFMRNGCYQCHGTVGQGSPVTGPKLAPNPIPFDTLSNFVRTTNRAMPPFSKDILSDEDLGDIYAYLTSIPKGPDPKDIPLLNP